MSNDKGRSTHLPLKDTEAGHQRSVCDEGSRSHGDGVAPVSRQEGQHRPNGVPLQQGLCRFVAQAQSLHISSRAHSPFAVIRKAIALRDGMM